MAPRSLHFVPQTTRHCGRDDKKRKRNPRPRHIVRAWGNLRVEKGKNAIRENGVPGEPRTDLKVGHYKD
jgi:hypothetical protein